MPLLIYNTLRRHKEEFRPVEPGQVKMYVCGVTVYDLCHLGHARAYVAWDLVRRYLLHLGYRVTYVQNFTDVDDKILRRALQTEMTPAAVAERYIAAYFEDMDRLNILRADTYPRATTSLPAMFDLIRALELKSFAYQVRHLGSSDVYYAVRQFADYGQLSGRRLADLQAGASGRVGEEESLKRDPFDFALWKSAPPDEPGFESPWGWGRPGWHLECSAMIRQTLGDRIDIHAGGADLIFPHHENELAQSEPVVGKPLATYWMHNGFVNIGGEKMSKSLGNFTTLRDALKAYDPMALRLFFLQTHYRSPIDLSDESMIAASNGWATLTQGLNAARHFSGQQPDPEILAKAMAIFHAAMDDDLGSPAAVAGAFDLAKDLIKEHNKLSHTGSTELPETWLAGKASALTSILETLGLLSKEAPEMGQSLAETESAASKLSEAEISPLIELRIKAKKDRDFAQADRIRDQLQAEGITLIDQKDGSTRWIRKS